MASVVVFLPETCMAPGNDRQPQNHFEHVTDNADKSNKTWSGGCCWLTSNAPMVQASNFCLQYPYLMKHTGHENKGNDRQT